MSQVNIVVNPAPQVAIAPSTSSVCPGGQANLVALGATTYTWNDLTSNPVKTVKPNSSTSYNVIGTNNFGCTGQASFMLHVFNTPNVSVVNTPTMICAGETARLEASGAITYRWMASTAFISDNPAIITPQVSNNYTVVGTDENGCTGSAVLTLVVDPCTGVKEIGSAGSINVHPNPTNGQIHITRNSALPATVQVTDVTGRVILNQQAASNQLSVDMTSFARGVYYVQIIEQNNIITKKIIKE